MPDSQPQAPAIRAARPPGTRRQRHRRSLSCGARLTDGRTVDVRLGGGRIEAVGTAGSLAHAAAPAPRVDLAGYLLLPAPAEPHAHGDTALTALSAGSDGPPRTTPRTSSAVRPRPRCSSSATARRHCARTYASATSQGLALAGGGAPGAAFAARARRSDGGRRAAAADRCRRGRRPGDAAGRGEDGRVRRRRLPRPRPRSRPGTWRRSWRSPRSTAAPSICTRTVTTRRGSPGSPPMAGGLRPGCRDRPVRRAGPAAARGGGSGRRPARRGRRHRGLPAPGRLQGAGTPAAAAVAGGARTAAARGRGAGRGRQRGAAGRANPVGRGDPLEAAYLLASHGEAASGGRVRRRVRGGPGGDGAARGPRRGGLPGGAAGGARRRSWRGRCRSRTAGSWCTEGGWWRVRARCASTATSTGTVGARPAAAVAGLTRALGRSRQAGQGPSGGLRAYGRGHAHCHRWRTRSDRAPAGAAARRARATRSRASSAIRSRRTTCGMRAPNRSSATWSRRRSRRSPRIWRARTRRSSRRARGRAAARPARRRWTAARRCSSPTRRNGRAYGATSWSPSMGADAALTEPPAGIDPVFDAYLRAKGAADDARTGARRPRLDDAAARSADERRGHGPRAAR